jgi:hypothetical protein
VELIDKLGWIIVIFIAAFVAAFTVDTVTHFVIRMMEWVDNSLPFAKLWTH